MKYLFFIASTLLLNVVSFAADTPATPAPAAAASVPAGHPSVAPAGAPAGHPPIDHKAMMKQVEDVESDSELNLQGKAVSVLPVKGYVYIEVVPDEGEKVWIAVPEDVVVKEGDTVHYKSGPVMLDFTSKSLDRTFSSVMFLPRVVTSNDTK
jgi:hypothetical protein